MNTTWHDIPPAPEAIGLFEMVLEVADLAASEQFYGEVLGLRVVERWEDDRLAVWFALGKEGFLGIWPVETGGEKAIHGGRGGSHVHYAVRVPSGTLDQMQARLESFGHEVEGGWEFGTGNLAIYVNDPDGNVVRAHRAGDTLGRRRGNGVAPTDVLCPYEGCRGIAQTNPHPAQP